MSSHASGGESDGLFEDPDTRTSAPPPPAAAAPAKPLTEIEKLAAAVQFEGEDEHEDPLPPLPKEPTPRESAAKAPAGGKAKEELLFEDDDDSVTGTAHPKAAPTPRPAKSVNAAAAAADDDDEMDGDSSSTLEIIAEARRPLLIERHRKLIEEMESSLSEQVVTGSTANPRLQAVIEQLSQPAAVARLDRTLNDLASDGHYKDATLRAGLVDELCLMREKQGIEVAQLQLHVIGVYRRVRELVLDKQGEPPTLADLREIPAPMLGRLITPIPCDFGSPSLGDSLVYTPAFADRCMRTIKRIRRADKGATRWEDANGEPPLPRQVEEPLESLPPEERKVARALAISERIRSSFYREVFLKYLSVDELDPAEIKAHRTILHWLEGMESTAHLYPFLQGQTAAQKSFRLSNLLTKMVQVHEIYARVATAAQRGGYAERFAGLSTRERLALLSKDHFPVLPFSPELTLAALLCPFASFVTWVQRKVEEKDFVIPPDPKR
jgi:hypothetical protein